MPRKERLFILGLPQIVQLQGHNKCELFSEDGDFCYFLECLDNALMRYGGDLHSYCLLASKALLLITPNSKENIGAIIQHVGRRYVPYFNKKYRRSGSLWEGRYKSCLVEAKNYLLPSMHFVESGAMEPSISVAHYPWNSYNHNIGEASLERISSHREYILLGKTTQQQAEAYRRFSQRSISRYILQRISDCIRQNTILGMAKFCQQLENQLQGNVRPRKRGRPRKNYNLSGQHLSFIERKVRSLCQQYSYTEIKLPIIQDANSASELLSFSLTPQCIASSNHQTILSSDGSFSCLKFVNQHLELLQGSKVWYQGPIFRHAYEQHDMLEQYIQIGVEAFGWENDAIVAEQLQFQYDFFKVLELEKEVELRINHIGSMAEFTAFRQALTIYFQPFSILFDATRQAWLQNVPERILVDYPVELEPMIKLAPKLSDYLSITSLARFQQLEQLLDNMGLPYIVDHNLYPASHYSDILFEWHAEYIAPQTLVCRGGRYDEFISKTMQRKSNACGFAFMLDNIIKLLLSIGYHPREYNDYKIVVIPEYNISGALGFNICRQLRQSFPSVAVTLDCAEKLTIKRQANASKQGNNIIVIINEHDNMEVLFKHHREVELSLDGVRARISRLIYA
ncbi:ATP phosphoribosyltransferase regulatory subunit [Photobacterium angustum]|uniref:ATP phosphoribosyltransferase regulatory subunit n=1 Tax=Photobacterium angustum TaxID=661 RepID=UPI0005E2D9F3|nr:ATP phosphoribosyltransferase regulatory subunit [Photobacterium angustum]KJF99039.1 hypothetical protein UB35_20940 [Photobacterium angustum]KJG15286.1 hypothetical protein UA33_20170 [Photobacterium angustum]KJG20344.1 hypothetical protein UA39_19845 [Photobacterium angustum]KJG27318.1 hypothetical protein UA36_20240 [Photobacterium angustum]PSV65002.1 hypothetical protein CTM95_17650 [Photobacterium angustum]